MKVLYIKGGGDDLEFIGYLNSLFSKITETVLVSDAVGKLCIESFDFIFINSHTLSMDLAHSISALRKLGPNSELFVVGKHFPETMIDKAHFIELPILEQELESLLSKNQVKSNIESLGNSINLSQIKKISNGDEAFVKDIVETFLSDFPEYINGLKASLMDKDMAKVGFYCHKLKAPLNMFGITELNEVIHYLDDLGQEDHTITHINWDEISNKVTQVVKLGERTSREIKAMSEESQI